MNTIGMSVKDARYLDVMLVVRLYADEHGQSMRHATAELIRSTAFYRSAPRQRPRKKPKGVVPCENENTG